MKVLTIKWLPLPEEQDYPAATSYLHLTMDGNTVADKMRELRKVPISHFAAKDIFRASGLKLFGISNYHVKKDRKKIDKGQKLSPLLLVRQDGKVIIADGYHRLCAVWSVSEDEIIPCKIV